jgi:hypothetical protein
LEGHGGWGEECGHCAHCDSGRDYGAVMIWMVIDGCDEVGVTDGCWGLETRGMNESCGVSAWC